MGSPESPTGKRLLATMTQEPFQPVRLTYSIPSAAFALEKLSALECVAELLRGRVLSRVENGNGAFSRWANHRPLRRRSAGGTRHGREYQEEAGQ